MERRDFLKLGAVTAGAALGGKVMGAEATRPKLIGMPISVAPLARGDLERLFGDMVERAGVTALFPFLYSHEAHRGGVSGAPYRGGNFARPHMEFYRGGPFTYEDMRATDFGDVDVLERALPVAQRHGIRIFPFILEDNSRPKAVPHWTPLYEVDHHGRRSTGHPGGPCFNNPQYQAFTLGLMEDYARSYPIGGIMWGSERQSGLLNTLSLTQSSGEDPGKTTCFCEYCQAKGRSRGIDVERARQGYDAAEKLIRETRAGRRPRDGTFTALWRILLNYPEALAWENLWVTSRHEFQAAIYRRVKSAAPQLQMGWHAWHNISFSPFQRAEEDYSAMTGYADFIRPALYNHVAGPRFRSFIRGARESAYGDLSGPETLAVLFRQLGYPHEAGYDEIERVGLSADYVEHETRRAATAVAGSSTQIWPGVDIDVPAPAGMPPCTPESVGEAVTAVFHGGAQGIILSRNYTEMKPENLSGAGAALRKLGVIVALLVFALVCGQPAQAATTPDASDPQRWESGRVGFGLLHRDPKANIMVVTEYTSAAKKLPTPSADRPVYYEGTLTAVTMSGDPVANMQPPSASTVLQVLDRALQDAHLAPWSADHHPQVYLRVWWGVFNRISDFDQSSTAQSTSVGTTGANVGDLAQAANLYDRAVMVGGSAFASKYMNFINEETEMKVPPFIRHINEQQFYLASPHNEALADEIVTDRYFIVVGAYDLAALAQHRHVLLWRTMISTDAQGLGLRDSIPALIAAAGAYIGHPTDGAVRLNRPLVRQGRVTVGTPVPVNSASPIPQ